MSRWGICGVAGVLAAHVLAGCASEQDSGSAEPSPTPTEAEPAATAEELALEAYEGMWDVVVEQSRTTDPDYAELDRYAEGEALDLAEHGLGAEAEEGVVARGEPTFSPEVTSHDEEADAVEIEDCVDSTQWLREDAETGDLVDEEPEEPIERRVEATVTSDGLAWRVSELRIWEEGSC